MKSGANTNHLWIGTSGYIYQHWSNGVFYPHGLPSGKWLDYYQSQFSTVELNNTFYRLPDPDAFKRWRERTRPDFRFFVKGSRFVTHMKKLKDPKDPLSRFFHSVNQLKEKLAGVLWQTPANFTANFERLEVFLRTFRKMSDTRVVFEFRHPSWFDETVTKLFREHGAVFCRADLPDFYQGLCIPATSDFVYYRRHGGGTHAGDYSLEQLKLDAKEIHTHLQRGEDMFEYFNNDIGGFAPKNAITLESLVTRMKRGTHDQKTRLRRVPAVLQET